MAGIGDMTKEDAVRYVMSKRNPQAHYVPLSLDEIIAELSELRTIYAFTKRSKALGVTIQHLEKLRNHGKKTL